MSIFALINIINSIHSPCTHGVMMIVISVIVKAPDKYMHVKSDFMFCITHGHAVGSQEQLFNYIVA